MELEEFRNKVCQKSKKGKNFKVQNSFGVFRAYKVLKKNHWYNIGRPLKEKEFFRIIRGINDLLAENIVNGIPVKFPEKMGELELMKEKRGVSFVDGKLKNTYPIDWDKTLRLWYEDPEAYQQRILVRNEQKEVFIVRYKKNRVACYENKTFYQFVLNRFIKKALKENIQNGKIDTLYGK